MAGEDAPPLDIARIVTTLHRHGVEHLIVGGVSATGYGAERPTKDYDCLPRNTIENLDRVAAALREMNARLRVGALSDEESKQLPVQIDAQMLRSMEIVTWRTDAGDIDVLKTSPPVTAAVSDTPS